MVARSVRELIAVPDGKIFKNTEPLENIDFFGTSSSLKSRKKLV